MPTNKANKVKFGLKNVHYAMLTEADGGEVTYGTPVAILGAVNLSMDAQGDTSTFYADDMAYSAIKQAAGDAFDERGGASRAGGTAIAYLYLDGVKVGRAVYPYIQGETTRLGTKLVGGRR